MPGLRAPLTGCEDQFWTVARNTAVCPVLRVTLMVAVSLVTAQILNRNMARRRFIRAVFFFPVLLSPLVLGLIWRRILQREEPLNLLLVSLGFEPQVWLNDCL